MTDQHQDAQDDPQRFVHRLQAEIEAAAEIRRRQDPDVRRLEREIERTWASLAPPGATGTQQELLLDRAERLSLVDVDAPVGQRPGVRHVKTGIRKATYWYLRYVTDQLNALHNVMTRLLRNLDERVGRLETAASLDPIARGWIDGAAAPDDAVVAAVADAVGAADGVVVAWCGPGEMVQAIGERGGRCYGLDRDAETVADGVHRGLDLRVADPLAHVAAIDDGALGALVLTSAVELLPLVDLVTLVDHAARTVRSGGSVVVAAADPEGRAGVEAELLRGRGIGPETWARVLAAAGFSPQVESVAGERIDRIVVAART